MPLTLEKISYSSVMQFLRNPSEWHRIYLMKNYREKDDTMPTIVGRAFHKCMEVYYQGWPKLSLSQDEAIAIGLALIDQKQNEIKFNEGSDIEDAKKQAEFAMRSYFAEVDLPRAAIMEDEVERDDFWSGALLGGDVLGTETKYEGPIRGVKFPIKVFSDRVVKHADGTLTVDDYKVVASYDKHLKAAFYVQAVFNAWGVHKLFGIWPRAMRYIMVKKTKNRDGSPQCRVLELRFGEHPWMEKAIKKLIKQMLKEALRKNRSWLPNPDDQLFGDESWNDWLEAEGFLTPEPGQG